MPSPTPYIISYNFAGFQANNPSAPPPGQALDNELANIAAAVAALVSAMQDVRRSDGALKNGVVTFDSFEQGLQLLLDPTNGQLVAAAVATAQAAQAAASGSASAAVTSATDSAASAAAAAASAGTVNLSLYLAKANNLAGLGSLPTSRTNLGLGSSAVLDAGTSANNVVQLNGSAKLPAVDGSLLTNIDIFPVGGVTLFPATAPPTGWLECAGQLVSRATYSRLWTYANASGAIQPEATWSSGFAGGFSTGDLSTTFRIPELRSEFFRGWDHGRGVDTARAIGTNQADSLKDHTHSYNYATAGPQKPNSGGTAPFDTLTAGTTGSPSTGAAAETRPRNVALMPCIKF